MKSSMYHFSSSLEVFTIPEDWLNELDSAGKTIRYTRDGQDIPVKVFKDLNGLLTFDTLILFFTFFLNYKSQEEWPMLLGRHKIMDKMISERLQKES